MTENPESITRSLCYGFRVRLRFAMAYRNEGQQCGTSWLELRRPQHEARSCPPILQCRPERATDQCYIVTLAGGGEEEFPGVAYAAE